MSRLTEKKLINSKKQLIADARKDGCIMCGESDLCCLDLHHLDPNMKERDIAALTHSNRSIVKLKLEIVKCICLCSNCHRKVHAGSLILPKRTNPA